MPFDAHMMVERPGDIVMTLKLSMSMTEWEELREQLAGGHPAWKLSAAISDMLAAARKIYFAAEIALGPENIKKGPADAKHPY